MEGAHPVASGSGAFCKNHQAALSCQHTGQLILNGAGRTLTTLDKTGAGGARQPADHRPVAYFRLGQKVHWRLCAEHHDIQP
tara:strand:+ start:82025 stop:82270 length:246 start_codon:yes stop_codon:yes gene_type:complete